MAPSQMMEYDITVFPLDDTIFQSYLVQGYKTTLPNDRPLTASKLFQSGKTHLANFLANAFEFSGDEYWPTKAARILEFDIRDISINNRKDKVDVELGDVSGDRQ